MLSELSQFENLGTPKFHFELLNTLNDSQSRNWLSSDVAKYFHNRIIEGRNLFDGCLPLLNHLRIVKLDYNKFVSVDEEFKKFLMNQNLMSDRFIERLILWLSNDIIFHKIFCSEFISWDIIYHSLQIENSAFPLKYSAFKQLLIDFNVIQSHPTKEFNRYIINGRYKKLFDKVVLPEIRKRKIGAEELMKSLAQKQINGEEAEKFVLQFEISRLNNSKEIDWVAEYSVAEGYDIASFNSENSIQYDRFIEVKSYQGEPYFYWTRNEMEIARIKKSNYFIYLVDRGKMGNQEYQPIIIQNPYTELLVKKPIDWKESIEKIRFDFATV
ncbi:MAG TPA: DUF3883 domain-containing protein [Cyclobacteriaceae bacterium]|nr:DUF3883 domain-containing protein [Cyclobacteriaceae bacterium]